MSAGHGDCVSSVFQVEDEGDGQSPKDDWEGGRQPEQSEVGSRGIDALLAAADILEASNHRTGALVAMIT